MKTIKMTRTIGRKLPNGWLIWVGPDGIHVRPKRTAAVYHLTWEEIIDRAQFVAATRQLHALGPNAWGDRLPVMPFSVHQDHGTFPPLPPETERERPANAGSDTSP